MADSRMDPTRSNVERPGQEHDPGPGQDLDGTIYRHDSLGPASRLAELQSALAASIEVVPGKLLQAYGRRMGRIAFGCVALLGGMLMFGEAIGLSGCGHRVHIHYTALWQPTIILLMTWVVGIPVYFLARAMGRQVARHELARLTRPRGDVYAEISRLQGLRASDWLAARVMHWEYASMFLPLAGLALIGPLTLHLVIAKTLLKVSLHGFDQWIMLSAFLVGIAHLALVYYAVAFAREARTAPLGKPLLESTRWKRALWAIGFSAVPGMVFVLPVIIAAITGIVHVPLAYAWLGRSVDYERDIVLRSRMQ